VMANHLLAGIVGERTDIDIYCCEHLLPVTQRALLARPLLITTVLPGGEVARW